MKFDPDIHIVMHSVLSLKPGVTGGTISPHLNKLSLMPASRRWKMHGTKYMRDLGRSREYKRGGEEEITTSINTTYCYS